MKDIKKIARDFWKFLNKDTWPSFIVSLVLIVILIKFVIFPGLSLVTGSSLPLVVVESCSMYHSDGFEKWWEDNSEWYTENGIEKENFSEFPLKNGFNKGDIIFVRGRFTPEMGDVIIFQPENSLAVYPIIHRVVSLDPIETKGDNNFGQLRRGANEERIDETDIQPEQVIGKAVFKIPFLGWIKLILFELFKSPSERGFCS